MSDAKKPAKKTSKTGATKKAPKKAPKKASARGLGRGLSALMADVSVPAAAPETQTPETQAPKTQATKTKLKRAPETKSAEKRPPEAEVSDAPDSNSKQVQFISIARLDRNPDQPRKIFKDADLLELTNSIARQGVLQPILVRPIPESARSKSSDNPKAEYQIVAGERRWQASLKAGLNAMPVLIRDLSDQEVLEIGIVENVQRADLNPIEEARAYRALMTDFGRTQSDVSDAIGKSRSHIANLLRILDMPLQVQRWVQLGKLSLGHAKAIMSMPDPTETAEMIMEQGLSVRGTEAYVKRYKDGEPHILGGPPITPEAKDPNIAALERQLTDMLGLKVNLKHKGPGGDLKIKYNSSRQLDEVIKRLKG